MVMECGHAYRIPLGPIFLCLNCHRYFESKEEKTEYKPIVMPPRVYNITKEMWDEIAPWKIPFELVQKFRWYISFLNKAKYLVMPIIHNGKSVYYSARKIDGPESAPKYNYQAGTRKEYWWSNDAFTNPVLIGEGVADGVALSQFGTGLALLGTYYNRTLDERLAGKDVYLVFDSDMAGILASARLYKDLSGIATSITVVNLPTGKDPTDYTREELKGFINAA